MRPLEQTLHGEPYVRLHKNKARLLFEMNAWIYVVPYKTKLDNPWFYPYIIRKHKGGFDKLVKTFIYYNCDSELGRYPAFYIKKSELKQYESEGKI